MKKLRIGVIGVLAVAVFLMSLNLIVSAAEDKREAQKQEQLAAQSAMELYQKQVGELEKKLSEYYNNRIFRKRRGA